MKVQVHTYDSEMGRTGGGVMNMTAKSGANAFHGSGLWRVPAGGDWSSELLIPKLLNQPNVPEYWRNGGGGGGGPIVKNKTFFWIAGEKYVDNQPQQSTFLVPTAAELTGNFNGVTRNGSQVDDQGSADRSAVSQQSDSRQPAEPGRPRSRELLSDRRHSRSTTASSNFSMTDLLPSQAYQITGKVDQHFNESMSLSGFLLRQVTHEANSNYNPVNKFVGSSYQLDRVIKTFVVNNTYILNSSTVLTLRGGYNHFDDNYNLPYPFDADGAVQQPGADQPMSDTNRFPTTTITGYKSSRLHQSSGQRLLPVRRQRHAEQADGHRTTSRSAATSGRIGATSLNYGASTGSYTSPAASAATRSPTCCSAIRRARSTVPLNTNLDGYVRYFSGYAAGRLAREQQADDQLRPPPRERDRA